MAEEEEQLQLQQLRSKATELFIREEWSDSIDAYSHFITLCTHQISISHSHTHPEETLQRLHKSLCIALCNRAEARSKLRDFHRALQDCNHALSVDATHFKTLVCKGKILLDLNRYSMALDCFRTAAMLDGNSECLNGYLEKCKKFEFLSRTGSLDLSEWVLNGFTGKTPELAEHIGAVQIGKSEISGRGLFAKKNIEAGSVILITKAIATERSILTDGKDLSEDVQLVMWKNFIDKVADFIRKCHRTRDLIGRLSIGEDDNEDELEVPDVNLFRSETEVFVESLSSSIDMVKLLAILDVNSLTEDAVSANVLRKKQQNDCSCYGVGIWLLPAFINHSCCPNARRLHVGDYLVVHASKDLKAGEEITFAYLDPLVPLNKRKEMLSVTWGIQHCKCKRCRFEGEILCNKQEMKEIENGVERRELMDVGGVVYKIEEQMKRWKVRGKEKGYLRASFWSVYEEAFRSERSMKRWGRRIPSPGAVVDSITDVVGGDHRLLRILMEEMKKNGSGRSGHVEMERAFKLGKEVYGKVVKKQAMRTLLDLCVAD